MQLFASAVSQHWFLLTEDVPTPKHTSQTCNTQIKLHQQKQERHSAMKPDCLEDDPMRNFHRAAGEVQWDLKYLLGNKHIPINRHWTS